MDKTKIVFATGGTGGHVFPAQSIFEHLKKDYDFYLVIDKKGSKFLSKNIKALPCLTIDLNAPKRLKIFPKFLEIKQDDKEETSYKTYKDAPDLYLMLFTQLFEFTKNLSIWLLKCIVNLFKFILYYTGYFFTFVFAIGSCIDYLSNIKPKFIIGFGSYATAPALIAAFILRIPILIHEQNSVMGLVNSVFGKVANKVMLSFPLLNNKSFNSNKYILTGNPLRKSFYEDRKYKLNWNSYFSTDHDNNLPKIKLLIVGGSQGSDAFSNMLPNTRDKFSIYHQTRDLTVENLNNKYKSLGIDAYVFSFSENLCDLIKQADFIISRSGATIVSEIISLNKRAILVPIKNSKGNHQYYNAKYAEEIAMAKIVQEEEFTIEYILSILNEIAYNNIYAIFKEFKKNDSKSNPIQIIESVFKKFEDNNSL